MNQYKLKTHQTLAQLLVELENALRQENLWQDEQPSSQALQSTAPFAIDTLTFVQWLQFIFLEKMQHLVRFSLPLPNKMLVLPMANEYFKSLPVNSTKIEKTIGRIDDLIHDAHAKIADLVEDQDLKISASSPDLEILYQDQYLVAVNKPSGLLVHRSWLDTHATEFALQKVRNQIGQYVFPVHRLDRPTSGILLFALDKETAKQISEQFAEHKTTKRYLAVVRGYLEDGEIDYALREELDKIADKQAKQDKPAQSAQTSYRCLAKTQLPIAVRPYDSARYSLMELTPKTGRKHQLRRHMAHLRHPIIGDTSHGDGKHNAMLRENFASHRLLLHAAYLSLSHPHTGELLEINAPLDTEFKSLLASMQLDKLDEINH